MAKGYKKSGLQGLPACAAEFIKLVIKKMRYRKKIRADVMTELIAHFEDELKECTSDEEKEQKAQQLITEFGDVKLLAVLLRRAKKRCRPLNLYLKIFLAMGIPFGLFMGVFYSLEFGFPRGLIAGLLAGLFYGGFMSLILGLWQTRSVERIGYAKSDDEAMGVHHTRNIELPLAYDEVFDLCISSLNLVKRCKIREEDHSQSKIKAKTGITWKTFGDIISFNVYRIDDNRIKVEVSSKPALRTALIDYGKNLENVEKITKFLAGEGKMIIDYC